MTLPPSTANYAAEAPDLFIRYEKRRAEEVHADILKWLPAEPSTVLDVGSGTGRDAAWLAGLGHQVLAVEPVPEMREGAKKLHPDPNIMWMDDHLPGLTAVRALGQTFDLIMMTAVWMHFDEEERAAGLENITSMMRSGSRLFMTQRHGPVPEGRRMFDVSGDETAALAAKHGLKCLLNLRRGSIGEENIKRGIEWTVLAFEKT